MKIQINKLPTKTWNRLGMNGSAPELPEGLTPKSPAVSYDPRQVSWTENALSFPQGAPAELQQLMAEIPVCLGQTEENIIMDAPMVLRCTYEKDECSATHLVLRAAKNSVLKALVVLEAPEQAEKVAVLQTQIYAEDNARVDLYVVQLLSGQCVNHIGGICGENAQITLTRLELGADRLFSGVNMDLNGDRSSFSAEIGCHARPGQALDMNYVSVHRGKKTETEIRVSDTLEENSRKIFRGTIDFQKGCAGAKGTENENVLLMSEDVVNQTLPVILCKEEDVEGNHGASIGQLDDKILFYLGSRGFTQEAARQMIARARIEAICHRIPNAEVQEQIRTFWG